MYLVGFENLVAIIVFIFLTGLTLGVFLVVQTTMIADAVDDVEAPHRRAQRRHLVRDPDLRVEDHERARACSCSASSSCSPATRPGSTVTPEMQETVFVAITLVPAISCLLSAIPFWFYRLGGPRS